jgi:hypothetical protein
MCSASRHARPGNLSLGRSFLVVPRLAAVSFFLEPSANDTLQRVEVK